MKKINYLAIIQARIGSTRYPGKVLKKINGKTLINILSARLSKSKKIDKIIFAIPDDSKNNKLYTAIKKIGYECYRGSEFNVLDRYYKAAILYKAKNIIRITADCPLIDPALVDLVIKKYENTKVDYCSNVNPPTYPDGLDTEVFSLDSLKKIYNNNKNKIDLEHVTTAYKNTKKYKTSNLENDKNFSFHRWTIDQEEDFNLIKSILKFFNSNIHFIWQDIIKLSYNKPEIFLINKNIKRNQGLKMGSGQKLYLRAKKVIPGGNMLLSKRPEMFLPEKWPSYFSKSKGCEVWDLDNKKFFDLSIMGIGTNILGYGHTEVDKEVIQNIKKGNMSTLNCPEEVMLAEKLLEINPWSRMVRFTRTGGEANAVAIRIARAASGKDNIAVCGYHGWHDWYLSSNIAEDDNLSGHLLPGLEPKGVPKVLKNTTFTFEYNNIEQVKFLIKNKDIGVIKMEVMRNKVPKNNFLKEIRNLCSKHNIVLIFDECTTGFRTMYGGLHKKFDVIPDMALFGKALGNGYAINAIIGKREIMEEAQQTFISSTFWTERIGPTAALKTLEVMKKIKSWEIINSISKKFTKKMEEIAQQNNLDISIDLTPATINFKLNYDNWLKYKTLLTQEMLKKGFLASSSVFICIEHTEKILDRYFYEMNKVFSIISDCINEKKLIDELLEGPISHSSFRRLN